jgi:hypothetical protein
VSITSRKGAGTKGAGRHDLTEFDLWLRESFATHGAFTALVVLVKIGGLEVAPLASTFFNIIGDEIRWPQIVALFAGSGKQWDGAAFFPVLDSGGPLLNGEARSRLRALEARVKADRLVLNEGHFFDAWGRRLKIEEATAH